MVIGDEKAEQELAARTREAFNDAARGPELEAQDEPAPGLDLEPDLADKKEGAALDQDAAQRTFAQYKSQTRDRSRGLDLAR